MANIFSKAWKGIKKVAKKIGKGIKKVVKKIGRAVGKLGLVGQIGMMFLMPYAMQGLGSLFGQFASGTAGTWANTLAASSNVGLKALGLSMNAIHTVGTTVMKPFTFIRDQIGKSGIELMFENDLRGKNGKKVVEVDRRGRVIRERTDLFKPPIAGNDVHLTIDIDLQSLIENELERSIYLARNKSLRH